MGEVGLHTSAVHFNESDDTIEILVFVLAKDNNSQSLTSSVGHSIADVFASNGFVGVSRPTRDSDRVFKHKLLSYPILINVREMIEKKQFLNVFTGEGSKRDNYIANKFLK